MDTFTVVTVFIFYFYRLSLSVSFIKRGEKNVSQCAYVFRTDNSGIVAFCHVLLRLLL